MNTSNENRQNNSQLSIRNSQFAAKQKSRRRFLGALLGVAGSAATVGVFSPKKNQKNGPTELPLHEADFYKPHNLAG
jgi:Rieske Fe-S protein